MLHVEVDYTPKGSDIKIQGINTYKTGPPNSTTAILLIGDMFGNVAQVLQGAGESPHQNQVSVPGFLQRQYAKHT